MLMTVECTVTPPSSHISMMDVLYGGKLMVVAVGNFKGGNTIWHGGGQAAVCSVPFQIDGSTNTMPPPLPPSGLAPNCAAPS
jgi:hypothetical protein